MIELERHIEILLLSNDCVIVPDLGGFMAHHVDARYDEEDHLFLPPLRTLGFNPQLKINDSLLAQSYIEAYDISYPEAVRRIEDEVNELRQHLDNEGSYELNDIGVLFKNEDGNYEFSPCEAGILTPELYGLSSFEMEEVKADIQTPALTIEKTETAMEIPLSTAEETEEEPAKVIHINMSALRKVAVACVVAILFFAFSTPLGNHDVSTINQSRIDTGLLNYIIPKSSVSIPVKKAAKTALQDSVQQQQIAIQEESLQDSLPHYCIVLASKVSKKNAEYFVSHLHQKGFEQARVMEKPKNIRVIYGQYKSENEAYNALKRLNGNEEFAEGWVMRIG